MCLNVKYFKKDIVYQFFDRFLVVFFPAQLINSLLIKNV